MPAGPIWRRYNEDGYGEHEDGNPFDGNGIGRCWPLLTGERAHYELAAGRSDSARNLLTTLEAFANSDGLLPEQTWDGPDIPERELFFGKPSGSAMPLVWAHAEYLKLCRSLADGDVFDMPPQTVKRYSRHDISSKYTLWAFNHKVRKMTQGNTLRLFLSAPARIRWSADDWSTEKENKTHNSTLGVHVVDLPTRRLKTGRTIRFTIYWLDKEQWDGTDYAIEIRNSIWREGTNGDKLLRNNIVEEANPDFDQLSDSVLEGLTQREGEGHLAKYGYNEPIEEKLKIR